MRGFDQRRDGLFSYVRPESRIPKDHPLRLIRRVADEALGALDVTFAALYSENGRPQRQAAIDAALTAKPSTEAEQAAFFAQQEAGVGS